MNISQEHVLCTAVLGRDFWLECLEDVEMSEECFGFVEIVPVLPAPEKGLPFGALDAADIDAPVAENRFFFRAEVVADDADNLHVGEVTSGHGEVSSGPSEFAFN